MAKSRPAVQVGPRPALASERQDRRGWNTVVFSLQPI